MVSESRDAAYADNIGRSLKEWAMRLALRILISARLRRSLTSAPKISYLAGSFIDECIVNITIGTGTASEVSDTHADRGLRSQVPPIFRHYRLVVSDPTRLAELSSSGCGKQPLDRYLTSASEEANSLVLQIFIHERWPG